MSTPNPSHAADSPNARERAAFGLRLTQALEFKGWSKPSPARLAREFNLRYSGTPVTPQSVRKWLRGQSVPSTDKLRVLASWLGVSVQDLLLGGAPGNSGTPNPARVTVAPLVVAAGFGANDFHSVTPPRNERDLSFERTGALALRQPEIPPYLDPFEVLKTKYSLLNEAHRSIVREIIFALLRLEEKF